MSSRRARVTLNVKVPAIALLLLLPLLLLGGSLAQAQPTPGAPGTGSSKANSSQIVVMKVYFSSIAERDRLASELDAEGGNTSGGFLTVWGDMAEYDALKARGLRVEIDPGATEQANKPVVWGHNTPVDPNNPDTFYGGYYTVEEMQAFLNQMATQYPTLAEVVDIGDSWCKLHPGQCTQPNTWTGFDMLVLHITNRNITGPKPVYWLEAAIHSREIATPEVTMDFIKWLLNGYASNADAHWLVDWHDIWVLPMVNPDGHHVVESGGGNPVSWRKNYDHDDGCNTYGSWGVDMNRNFPFKWGCCGGSSGYACDETYRGPSAGSEPEIQGVMTKISQLIPDQRGPNDTDPAPITTTGVYQSMHSVASLNLYAWGWTGTASPNGPEMANIGSHMSVSNAYPPGNTYQSCQPPNCLYGVDGDSVDWGYGVLGIPSFTTELGGGSFFPSYATTQNVLWPQNRGMLTYLAKIARTPYLLSHGPDASGVATVPMTVTQGTLVQLNGTINFAWSSNAFSQNVGAAEYYIDTPPWAGGTAAAMQAVDGQFDSPTEAVQATINTSGVPVGTHVVFVRGRGQNNYQGYQTWGPVSATWLVVNPYLTPTPTVTGTPPTSTPTPTNSPTITPTSTPCSAPALQNGGFETGSFAPGWTIQETSPAPVVRNTQPRSGLYSAFLGNDPGTEPTGNSSVYQQFTVPAGGGTLSFWYYPYTEDTISWDWQDAYIQDANGNTLATVMHVCDGSQAWTNVTYNLNSYAGQTIRVKFLVHQDGAGDATNMYVDDVFVLTSCGTPGPSNTPTNTPTRTPTVTLTPTGQPTFTPTRTPTGSPTPSCCGQLTGGVLASCSLQGTYNFVGIVEVNNPCPTTVPAVLTTYLEVSIDGQTFQPIATVGPTNVNIAPGPPPWAQYQFFTGITIGSEYNYYRITAHIVEANNCHEYYFASSPQPICTGPLPTNTGPPRPTDTPQATYTPLETHTPGPSPTPEPPTVTPLPPTPCPIEFSDVLPDNPFYPYVRCLACRGIVTGYSDNTFRPNNNITRGQIAKVVSNSANFQDDVTGRWTYTDVPDTNTFWLWIERLTLHGVMSGYNCGVDPNEPCDPQNRAYFRWANNATRAQLAKIDSNAAGFSDDPTTQTFTDVDSTHPFYVWIQRLASRSIMGGYQCGIDPNEPCDPQNRPYFRPYNNVTRGQAAKIVANTFYPNCETPRRK